MPDMTCRDALNLAQKKEMRRDPSVVASGGRTALYEDAFKVKLASQLSASVYGTT